MLPYQQHTTRKCDFTKVLIFTTYKNNRGPGKNFIKDVQDP